MAGAHSNIDETLAAADSELTDVEVETYFDESRAPQVLLRWRSHGKLKVRMFSSLAASVVSLDIERIRMSKAKDKSRQESMYLLGIIRGGLTGELA